MKFNPWLVIILMWQDQLCLLVLLYFQENANMPGYSFFLRRLFSILGVVGVGWKKKKNNDQNGFFQNRTEVPWQELKSSYLI